MLGLSILALIPCQIFQDYKELCVKLRDIPINQYTVCELVRLCLRRRDHDQPHANALDSDSDSDDSFIEDQEEMVR